MPPAHIEIIPAAPEQESIVANLLELYAHDFSEFHHLELGADGRFGYRPLSLYWSDPNRLPFLVRMNGELAGLVFVKRTEVPGDKNVWDMAEFFIVRAYRRRGIGTQIAHEVWRRSPGIWVVRVMESNHSALLFWERAIQAFTGETAQPIRVEKCDELWNVFTFESKPAS
jgi:predicted acetyltransferase